MNKKKRITLDGKDIQLETKLDMELFKHRLDFDMGDSFSALQAFVKAWDEGFYPPAWTLEWVAHGLINYRNYYYSPVAGSRNKKSLDDFLGLNSKKRLTPAQETFFWEKKANLFEAVSSLIALGVNPKRAFLKVSEMTKESSYYHPQSVIKKYYFEFRDRFPNRIEDLKKQVSTWTEADKKRVSFPLRPL